MIEQLLSLDENLLLFFNSLHTPWLDALMFTLTNGKIYVPFFLVVIGLIIYKFRWKGAFVLLLVALVVTLGDQLSSALLKPLVGRLRPTHEPHLEGLIHIVNEYKGGLYSFVSSHATNSFGVATILWLTLRKQFGWISIFFAWAAIFSFTRIYLGVHYPTDVLAGWLAGTIWALLCWLGARWWRGRQTAASQAEQL